MKETSQVTPVNWHWHTASKLTNFRIVTRDTFCLTHIKKRTFIGLVAGNDTLQTRKLIVHDKIIALLPIFIIIENRTTFVSAKIWGRNKQYHSCSSWVIIKNKEITKREKVATLFLKIEKEERTHPDNGNLCFHSNLSDSPVDSPPGAESSGCDTRNTSDRRAHTFCR